ncbi:aspartate kinase [Aliikangiella coralliicola]|uniref:Aspartokinase n=1 Tax=Aliikangiella coralliicola TaxID=2592383 RepID=A0A545U528_9GAMM|nr:aspartate kinase [Aliikangiella coralliicola]TQV84580.1 aspartate kinase [Aliikangiella coralliicola]
MANEVGLILTPAQTFDRQAIAVHKFGGSSLASKERLNNVAQIIEQQTLAEDFIVVSANGNITDWLVEFSEGEKEALDKISDYYQELVSQTLNKPENCLADFQRDIDELKVKPFSSEEILANGEIWSAKLLVELLNERNVSSLFIDARSILSTDSIEDYRHFDVDYFDKGIEREIYGNFGKRLIVTGYIAQDFCDETITLGRNGSDYSATLLARFGEAESVTLWTDVCGIYTADPRLVKSAHPVNFLTYEEARDLASVGTNVLHQKTISPLVDKNIPLFIRSSLEPQKQGTKVCSQCDSEERVKSIALKNDLSKINIAFNQDICVDTLLHQFFEKHIVALICEHSSNDKKISLLIGKADLPAAENILEQESLQRDTLTFEIQNETRSLISIVGKGVLQNSKLFESLEFNLKDKVQYRFFQGTQKNAINLVIQEQDAISILNQVYSACFELESEKSTHANRQFSKQSNSLALNQHPQKIAEAVEYGI